MKRAVLFIIAFAAIAHAQISTAPGPRYLGKKASDPATCSVATPQFYFNSTSHVFKYCSATNTWSNMSGGTVPSLASTTDVLTGTDSAKTTTADAIAALWEQGANIASSGTISIGEGGYFHVTGTTGITDIDFATDKTGRRAVLVFDGALTLTHNASTLILPTGANITTAAGDIAVVVSEGSDAVRIVDYIRANGQALATSSTVELGGVTDTTLSRSSAGVLAVEGTNVLLNGGALGTPSSGTLTNASGLPVAGITSSTSTALGVGSLELGHATDTTLSRSSSGVLAVEGTPVVLNTRKVNGQALSADVAVDTDLLVQRALGSNILAQSIPIRNIASTSTALADGVAVFIPVYLPKDATITGVKWRHATAGNYTADNYNGVGLYTANGTGLTLVASSTDDGNIWKQSATSVASKALSSPYAATAGLYYVGLLYNSSAQTTAPALQKSAITNTTSTGTGDLFAVIAPLKSSLTALPSGPVAFATDFDATQQAGQFWVALY